MINFKEISITFRNDLHQTEATLIAKQDDKSRIVLTGSQVSDTRKKLCGVSDCVCGGPFGERPSGRVHIDGKLWNIDAKAISKNSDASSIIEIWRPVRHFPYLPQPSMTTEDLNPTTAEGSGKEVSDFCEDKSPCWKLMDCSPCVYKKCPAYLNPERSCWNIPCTSSEALTGLRKDCKCCKVWNIYHPALASA